MKKQWLYFALAVLPSLFQPEHAPESIWGWFKYGAISFYQGLLALKALDSSPEKDKNDVQKVATVPGEPLETKETTKPLVNETQT